MKLKPAELEENGFVRIESLNHQEIVPFVQKYIKKWTFFAVLYYAVNLLILSAIILFLFLASGSATESFWDGINHLCYGFAIAFALVPIHELIHAAAYKYTGAEKTSYDANLKKFYFMAIADQFVANRKEFQIVALAPFVSISLALTILAFIVGPVWLFTILGTLLVHSSFCSGDFALLSYFEFHKAKEIVTYDDKEGGISYFYERIK